MTEQQREAFEKWAESENMSIAWGVTNYLFSETAKAWKAWQHLSHAEGEAPPAAMLRDDLRQLYVDMLNADVHAETAGESFGLGRCITASHLERFAALLETGVVPNEHGKNRFGLDMSYFRNAINRELNRPLTDYRPDELARVFARLSRTADPAVMREPEFTRPAPQVAMTEHNQLRADPDTEGEAPNIYWVLFDATSDKKYIKKLADDGSLLFYDTEDEAMHARRLYPGTDYQRVEYYTHPAPQVAVPSLKPGLEWAIAKCRALQNQGFSHTRLDVMIRDLANCLSSAAAAPTAPAGEPAEIPEIGSQWRHRNGNVYTVESITNESTERPEQYPVTVVYRGGNGKLWSRPARDWHRSMTFESAPVAQQPVSDPDGPTLTWDKPMTSKQAGRYLLTNGFVAVELYRADVQRLEKRIEELESAAPDEREIAARALSKFADRMGARQGDAENRQFFIDCAEEAYEEAARLRAGKEGE